MKSSILLKLIVEIYSYNFREYISRKHVKDHLCIMSDVSASLFSIGSEKQVGDKLGVDGGYWIGLDDFWLEFWSLTNFFITVFFCNFHVVQFCRSF